MNLQDKTIELLLENKKLQEASSKKVLLYPSSDYTDRMSPVNITNERGILFGWFNDEEIMAYSTGFNSIQDMEKAVKAKKYMIDSFADDEDFDTMSGEEWWNYIIKTINDSYVDGDSYWSMFLIDANHNYKILYCGAEKPDIEVVDNTKSKMILKMGKSYDKDLPDYPYFKYGKYKLTNAFNGINIDDIKVTTAYFDSIFSNFDDDECGSVEYVEEKLDGVDLLSLITDEQKIQYLQALILFLQKKEEIEEKRNQENIAERQAFAETLSKHFKMKIKKEIADLIYDNFEYELESNLNNLQPDLIQLLNKLEITDNDIVSKHEGEYIIEYLSKNGGDYKNFESNIDFINQAIPEGTSLEKAYEILVNIIANNYTSEDFIKFYNDPDITASDIDKLEGYLENYDISLNQLYKIFKNPDYQGLEIPVILGFKNKLNKEQLNNLITFCKTIGEESMGWLLSYHEEDILIDCLIPAIKENIPVKSIINAYVKADMPDNRIKNINKLIKKFKKEN